MNRRLNHHKPSTPAGRKLADLAAREIPVVRDPWPLVAARVQRSTRRPASNTSWSGPALDTAARRRVAALRPIEREEDHTMSDLTQVRERPWDNEVLRLIAAAIIFTIVGAALALLLRDSDDPSIVPAVAASPTTEATATVTQQGTPWTQVHQDRSGNTVEVSAWVSDPAPPADTDVTLTARIMVNGEPAADVPMLSIWKRRDSGASCSATTGADGTATCVANSGPTRGGLVDVVVELLYRGETYTTSVLFTTQP